MDDLDHPPAIDPDDHRSIAVRRQRRNTGGFNSHSRDSSASSIARNHGISTPPDTPNPQKRPRSKKRVRFSDPGPIVLLESASSGLTPFVRRTSLSLEKSKRRHSTPASLNLSNRAHYDDDAPLSGTLQFAPLRQVLDGRVKRRLRRNRLSEEVNSIEWDKRRVAKSRKREVERLRRELEAKDAEMQSMRDEQDIASQLGEEFGASVATSRLSSRVEELEQQITELKSELQRKEVDQSTVWEENPDWTMAAQDPFQDDDDNDDFMITNYDDDFGDNDEMITTPTRLNTSFPSPPSTSAATASRPPSLSSAGVQTTPSMSDLERDVMRRQLEALQSEITKLTSAVTFNQDTNSRLEEKLSEYIPVNESHDHSTLDSALDTVLTQLALTQSHVLERSSAFSALSNEIATLGFPSSSPDETISTIASQFRQARLDLEYLTPGENQEGFENDKLLEMLVGRIRVLLQKVKQRDESIDQYHDQELLLRQQVNTRVGALLDVQKELTLATSVVSDLRAEIEEKETGNERLRAALEGYRSEMSGLEDLIRRMEKEGSEADAQLRRELSEAEERLQEEKTSHETTRICVEGNDIMIAEYDRRLKAALQATQAIKEELASKNSLISEQESNISSLRSSALERERQHGEALALRDAQVSELRNEIERVDAALQSAHTSIISLRKQNQDLEAQVEGEKSRGRIVVQSMRDQLSRVFELGSGYLDGDVSVQGPGSSPTPLTPAMPVIKRGGFGSSIFSSGSVPGSGSGSGLLDGGLARRRKTGGGGRGFGGKKRRYDSGLGFLEECEDEGEEAEGEDGMGMGVEI